MSKHFKTEKDVTYYCLTENNKIEEFIAIKTNIYFEDEEDARLEQLKRKI